MSQEQIHSSLDKMLENPKTRNFLNHIVRSYMPISNVTKVDEKPKGEFKCVITRDELFSLGDILEGIETEQLKNDFMSNLKAMFDEKADKTSPMIKLIGDRKLGVTGKDTTTFMSYATFQEFYNWVVTKALKGDKHMNWLLKSIRHSNLIERAENIQDSDVQKKVNNFKKANAVAKTATFTLADSTDVLSQLKAKLEANGN